ncbi:F-box/LRR-repeat protein 6-like protein, partial [Leptotrombidium deliense]
MYGGNKRPLSLEPFLMPSDREVDFLLPTNVLTKIFQFVVSNESHNAIHNLLSLSQASETFRKLIISTGSLWKCVDLSDFKYNASERDLIALCEAGILSGVEKLNISGWVTGNSIFKIIDCCAPSLNEIILRECHAIGAECLQLLAEKCSALESIDLSRTSYSNLPSPKPRALIMEKSNVVQVSSLKPFLSTCGNRLKQLNLAENKLISFTSITSAIMTHCPNLRLLDLSNIETSSSAVIDVPKLQQSCPLLRVLRLASITLKASSSSQYSFTKLEELSIPVKTATVGHSDSVIYALTRTAENLTLLDIRGSSEVSVSCLVKIPAWNLQHLSISNCQRLCTPDLELVFRKVFIYFGPLYSKLLLAQWKNTLVDVDISWNNNDTSVNASLDALCSEDGSVLKHMNLRGSSVSLPTLKKMFKCCTKLEFVDLQSCRGLPRGIKRVFAGEELQKLKADVVDGFYD